MTHETNRPKLFEEDPRQLQLFDAEYSSALPAADAKYAHVVRFGSEPQRNSTQPPGMRQARQIDERAPDAWADLLVGALTESPPQTFNTLMIALANVTADVAAGTNADRGLWLAVRDGRLVHTKGPVVLFRIATANRNGSAARAGR